MGCLTSASKQSPMVCLPRTKMLHNLLSRFFVNTKELLSLYFAYCWKKSTPCLLVHHQCTTSDLRSSRCDHELCVAAKEIGVPCVCFLTSPAIILLLIIHYRQVKEKDLLPLKGSMKEKEKMFSEHM